MQKKCVRFLKLKYIRYKYVPIKHITQQGMQYMEKKTINHNEVEKMQKLNT